MKYKDESNFSKVRNRGVLEVVQFNSLNSKMRKLSLVGKQQNSNKYDYGLYTGSSRLC